MSRYAEAHADPQGAGDARPTALQIVEDENLVGKLGGKTAFVTGANQGIGIETARALHATGATVFLGTRDVAKGQQAVEDIRASDPSNDAPLHVVQIALDSLGSVREAATALLAQTSTLNLLILNAGVMCTPEGRTVDGFETQFGTNHAGHFLLFQLLKPALLAAATPSFGSRVISLSSIGHRAGGVRFDDFNFDKVGSYDPWLAYGQSKTANIYLANEIERRYGAAHLHALSVHPGFILTNLGRYMDPAVMAEGTKDPETLKKLKNKTQGAATTVYAALSAEWEGRGGRFLSDCAEALAVQPGVNYLSPDPGYAPWAYDQDKAAKLWVESNKLVGLESDA
ncbi:hypothetical protein EDB81DRAFT_944349 [Dactylonectria macrodidyma]|uniref:Uncharacterized protein n=1 Tax=Dactylonectria macrodidyma TaxID=307937 RepID=A0A9P9JHJ6_9HYPO|nr:hypothetical protein EDB81DRAFT_944349 [Dactylonectria macrodidyma]